MMHKLYVFVGHIFCGACRIWWTIRDLISKPKAKNILFVAHPDDDTLFFHKVLKEKNVYVCLLTTGYSLRRMPDFFKAMRWYGVRYRAYGLRTDDMRMNKLEKYIRTVLKLGHFEKVYTHNETGEYGHEEHARIHRMLLGMRMICTARLVLRKFMNIRSMNRT